MKEWGSVPTPNMADLSLSGLASGFDWKSLVDQLMQIEGAPITRLQAEQATNTTQANALKDVGTRLKALQTAAQKLKDQSLFSGRLATSATASSSWKLSAATGTPAGSYQIAVSQVASKARREGTANITAGISATSNVGGVTLGTMRTASFVTAGSFSINGQKISVATTDSLEDVFDAISTATSNDVTASYDPVTDKITLESASDAEIVLGASNDTSNFLQVMKLANNGTDTVASYGTLGTARPATTLATVGLNTAITAVDGSGNGTFSINGTSIAYNVNSDSLSTLISRINSSTAGVTASYDAVNDRMTLANNATGDLGMTLTEANGGVLAALGLTTGATTVRGQNAAYSINGGPTLISSSNTLDSAALGVTGLSVTVDSQTTQTITVAADTGKMKDNINSFITAYNSLQLFIDDKSKITTTAGKVTANVLSGNRDVQDWATQLRRLAFSAVSGVGGVDRLDDIGLDLMESGQITIKDPTKLDTMLSTKGSDVEAFFSTATTGFAAKFDTRLALLIKTDDDSQNRLSQTNTRLDQQIADLQRRLDQQKELLTNSFIAMESAQSKIKQQSTALSNAFGASSSS